MKLHFYILLLFTFLYGISYTNGQHVSSKSAIRFLENKNQWHKNVLYRADLPGGKLFIEKTKLTYVFYDTKILAELHDGNHGNSTNNSSAKIIETIPGVKKPVMPLHAFSVTFAGANSSSEITTEYKNQETNNFYIGSDLSSWASDVHSYGKINYKKIYPNTDLCVYEHQNTMKYEFIVYPGGDPDNIKLQYNGVEKLYLENGELHIKTSVNTITEQAPYIYQTLNGKEVKVSGRFELKDSVVTFKITGHYDKKQVLVIDPKLIFSTYSGSLADNWGNTAAFDQAGNMYSGGTVFGVGYPTTVGAFQVGFGSAFPFYGYGIDVGILKYNPTGTGLLYATYLGGNWTDVPFSLIVNNNDELVIFGSTSSTDFPTTTVTYDNSFNGGIYSNPVPGIYFENGSDLFVSKLSSNGSTLVGSTYIGGSDNEGILYMGEALTKNYGDQLRGDVTVDDQDNIYVSTNTRSVNFPVTAGALQPTLSGGGKDACVFKFNTAITSLLWSTYLGGTSEDASFSVQVDSLYNVFVAGGTTSLNFPITSGVLHSTCQGGIDGFVAHISSNGTSLISSTYLGTSAYDQAYFVQLDSAENVYILGQTKGAYPVTAGAYTNPNSGQFIHKLSNDLTTSLMSTVFGTGGNNPNISLTAFLVNDCGNIFLSGWGGQENGLITYNPFPIPSGFVGGNTTGMPVTSDAFQSATDGSDFYIMVLSKDAASLLYATFFGGIGIPEHVDGGTSRFDKKGIIYQAVCAGCGGSNAFPTTPGAWSNTNKSYFYYNDGTYSGWASNCNNAAFKFDLVSLKSIFTAGKADSCGKSSVDFVNTSLGGKLFNWNFGDGKTSNLQNPGTHFYTAPGAYTITLIVTDLTTCIGKDTSKVNVFVPPIPPIKFNVLDTTICEGTSVQLFATNNPTYTYKWTPATSLNADNIANPTSTPVTPITYHVVVEDTNQCKVQKNVKVNLFPPAFIDAGPNQLICPNTSVHLTATGNGKFVWELSPYLSCSVCKSPKVTPPTVSDDYYSVEITDINGCKKTDSVRVVTKPFPQITVSLDWEGRCYGEDVRFKSHVHLSDTTCPVAGNLLWKFGDGSSSNEQDPVHQYNNAGQFPVTVQYAYSNIAKDTVYMMIKDSCFKNVFIPNTFTPNGDGNNDLVYLRTINASKILLRIFNRWGEEVFRTESLHDGWDGTYKGVKQTPQTFVYTADVTFWDNTKKVLEGNITLVE